MVLVSGCYNNNAINTAGNFYFLIAVKMSIYPEFSIIPFMLGHLSPSWETVMMTWTVMAYPCITDPRGSKEKIQV